MNLEVRHISQKLSLDTLAKSSRYSRRDFEGTESLIKQYQGHWDDRRKGQELFARASRASRVLDTLLADRIDIIECLRYLRKEP